MPNTTESYKKIFKATSIFGGVQIFNILIALIRSKIVAVFLGPSGFGVMSLFNTTILLITGCTNFGLGTSAVKDVAAASNSGDDLKLGRTVVIFRRLVWITGGLGFFVTLILAPALSQLAFGNREYTISFMLLSITLLFSQLSAGQSVILRGMRKVQYLAKASVLGSLLGLVISLPMYFFFKDEGIVPAIILTSLSALILSWFYADKVSLPFVNVERSAVRKEGIDMMKMGFLISMSSLIGMGSSYLLRIFISDVGGIKDVGLFSAGFSLISTYVGMIFTAMSTDYFPRLANVASDNGECKLQINQQIEIALLIIAPILAVFLIFIKLGVVLLYSKEFLGIITMVQWAALGIYFRTLSWSIGFVFLAKGASKTFFYNELLAYSYMLLFNVLGYYYFGLTGLGVSFLAGYLCHFFQMYIVSRRMYSFSLENSTARIFGIQFLIALGCFVVVLKGSENLAYILGTFLITTSTYYSIKELNQKIGLANFLSKHLKR